MAVLGRDEFFARLNERLGNDTSDESISFLEDMTDTFNDFENRANSDGVNWEQKYKELDEAWKKKYRHRFFSSDVRDVPMDGTNNPETDEYNPEEITVKDLFEEVK